MYAVGVSKVDVKLRLIRIAPEFIRVLPRKFSLNFDCTGQLIKADALKFRGILENERSICDYRPNVAVFIPEQLFCPVLIRRCCSLIPEIEHGALFMVPVKRRHRVGVCCGKFCHRFVAFQVLAALSLIPFVEVAEFMNAHQVESIAELPARGVGRVIRVGEKVAVVDHKAGGCRTCSIGVAVGARGLRIDLRQEFRDGLRNRVCPAECADDAFFGCRVALLVRLLFPEPGHP